MFHVGQLVVCVDDDNWLLPIPHRPEAKRIYTIRAIVEGIHPIDGRGPGLLLDEIINPTVKGTGVEYNFDPRRFRPLRKTSISIFTAMLSPTKADA
jgi:hypothetical protein